MLKSLFVHSWNVLKLNVRTALFLLRSQPNGDAAERSCRGSELEVVALRRGESKKRRGCRGERWQRKEGRKGVKMQERVNKREGEDSIDSAVTETGLHANRTPHPTPTAGVIDIQAETHSRDCVSMLLR